jgi:hypothetical protein
MMLRAVAASSGRACTVFMTAIQIQRCLGAAAKYATVPGHLLRHQNTKLIVPSHEQE